MAEIKKFLEELFSGREDPQEPVYDPAELGGAVVLTLFGLGLLYWLLWTLLVYEGGIFRKIKASFLVLFTSKTLQDFGYEGTPYAMGAFEGWIGNLGALLFALGLVYALWHLYQKAKAKSF